MGRGWRRVSEAVRQKFVAIAPMGDDEFETTSNARNEAMLREASEFSLQIKIMEKDLLGLEKHMECQFINLRGILLGPLPRVFEIDGETPVHTHQNTHSTIGQDINVERLPHSIAAMKDKMSSEVLGPMGEWMRDYKKVQVEMRKLEAMRLEVDSRRRTVGDLDRQLTFHKIKTMKRAQVMKETGAASNEDIKLAEVIKDTDRKKAHKEEKMQDIRTSFVNHEEVVFNSLYTLIDDARSLRYYAATAMVNVQECFTSALVAFDGPGEQAASGALEDGAPALPASTPPPKMSLLRTLTAKLVGGRSGSPYDPRSQSQPGHQQRDQQAMPGGGFDAVVYGKIAPPTSGSGFEPDVGPPYRHYIQQHNGQQQRPSTAVPEAFAERPANMFATNNDPPRFANYAHGGEF